VAAEAVAAVDTAVAAAVAVAAVAADTNRRPKSKIIS
jgi:hypothetical protein